MKQVFVLLYCFAGVFSVASAQRFSGNKPAEKWKQVNQEKLRVIFPGRLDSLAQRIALVSATLQEQTSSTIGDKLRKINIVLQPYTTVSNAYVGLGPYRSEFFMTPLQNSFELGSLSWADNLAIHEYRHVQQYNNFNVGFSRLLGVLFGEQGQALANALVIPNWFWEGDAVFQETLVSQQGRGRLPFFYNDFRALWQANKNYDWMKLRNGSLKHFVPDHYRLGYMQVTYGRESYGDDFWKKVTTDAASFKGVFYPFQQAVRKHSGKRFSQFREAALQYFKKEYADTVPADIKREQVVINREFPQYTATGTLLYVKSGFRQVPVFVENKEGMERRIRVRDVSVDNQFSYRNGKIVYASFRPDKRWSWNDYSELQLLDVTTGVQRTLTRKTKYFSPDISEDGKSIVVVEVKPGGYSALHLVRTADGTVERSLPNPASWFYTYPKWINEKMIVAAVRNAEGQMALVKINAATGQAENITPFSWRVIGFPSIRNDTVFFTASNGSNDLLYAADMFTNKLYELTVQKKGVGTYQPAVTVEKLAFTTFTADGFALQQQALPSVIWTALSPEEWGILQYKNAQQFDKTGSGNLLSQMNRAEKPVSAYPKTFHLFNFHSINPLISDPDYTLSVIGENVLNTLQSELFFTYNRNEQSKQVGGNAVFGQWFPYITLGANATFDRSGFYNDSTRIYWNESQLIAGLTVPLNFSKGRLFTRLNLATNFIYNAPYYRGTYKDSVRSGAFGYMSHSLFFSNQVQQAKQHIFPRFAQTATVNYRQAISGRTGNQLNGNVNLYFPGLHVNHNLVFQLAVSSRDSLREVNFSDIFPFSRGYATANLYRMHKWGVNYHFPIVYPDKGVGNIVYLLRIRANTFFDHTVGKVTFRNNQTNQLFRRTTHFRSAGTELFFDTKWWNELPLSVGIRYSRLLDDNLFGNTTRNVFEIVLPVNLLQR
jgi:hypothetical protein